MDEDDEENVQVVANSTAKKTKVQEEIAEIKLKLKRFNENLNGRIDKVVGAVNHMAQCVDEFNDNYKRILDAVNQATTSKVLNSIRNDVNFPFTTPDELHAYVEADPEAVQLIDRLVRLRVPDGIPVSTVFPTPLQTY